MSGEPRSLVAQTIRNVVRNEFRLCWNGTHGAAHWARVLRNGRAIAASSKASLRVVELFAVLHDARRHDEYRDDRHGTRSAALVLELGHRRLGLSRDELDLLAYACRHHSDGLVDADITVQACWDSDRLDLWRVGIEPDPERLCTDAARRLLNSQTAECYRDGIVRHASPRA
jgi:uncharacterized protein